MLFIRNVCHKSAILISTSKCPFFHFSKNNTVSEKKKEKTEEDSIITDEEIQKIKKTKKNLEAQNLVTGLSEYGLYYVNKVEYLSELINDHRCVSIFRPRRMGKSTMISDLHFMLSQGLLF